MPLPIGMGEVAIARRVEFGDWMAYAVAKANDVPLLFKGNDFGLTDICPAIP
jgi:ribonuclease VapC